MICCFAEFTSELEFRAGLKPIPELTKELNYPLFPILSVDNPYGILKRFEK